MTLSEITPTRDVGKMSYDGRKLFVALLAFNANGTPDEAKRILSGFPHLLPSTNEEEASGDIPPHLAAMVKMAIAQDKTGEQEI